MTTIEWTKTKRTGLERAMKAAIKHGATNHNVFRYDGNYYVVGYAKYLLGYLDTQLPTARRAYTRSRGGR
jgi:hypothetical protein